MKKIVPKYIRWLVCGHLYNWPLADLNIESKYLILSHFFPNVINGNLLGLHLYYSLNLL